MKNQPLMETKLSQGGRGWQTPRGTIAIWALEPGIIVSQLSGYGDGALSAPFEAAFKDSLDAAGSVRMFFDVEELTGYHSSLRKQLTSLFLARKAAILELNVLVRSKLVSMGVSVANLALGGIVTSYTDRKRFTDSLEATLFRARVAGFSAAVLSRHEASRDRVK